MNNILFLAVIGLCAFAWVQNERVNDAVSRASKYQALLEGFELQLKNDIKFNDIDRGLRDGGENSLSDYMRGAADKLWPNP